ncbi:MAG: copper-binding protein [Bordetella sp.]|nr:copper-binding protein [Bordetella sp.]
MNAILNIAAAGLFSALIAPAHAAAPSSGQPMNMNMDMKTATAASPAVSASGEVKAIDRDTNKVTIAHGAIPALNWPPMTMRFTITPQTRLDALKPGDKVDFTFIQQGNLSLLQSIHAK